MIFLITVFLFFSTVGYADIFLKPEQRELDAALISDAKSDSYRFPYDYNVYALHDNGYELSREHIPLGINNYDFDGSLKNLMSNYEYKNIALNNPLLTLTYSSPTTADLYKHLETMGYLRLAIRYQQYQDLENMVNDPIVKLRKQAVLDCLKRNTRTHNIDAALNECFDYSLMRTTDPFENLEDPSDGRDFVEGRINVTYKSLDRVNQDHQDIDTVKEIVPRVFINKDSVYQASPIKHSRELINQYRNEFVTPLNTIVSRYRTQRSINQEDLSQFTVYGSPINEGQIKNLAMMDSNSGYLMINKVASNLAYLKAIDQYLLASQMLDRVMSHPAIQPGYKSLLQSSIEFINKEIIHLKEEKERLGQYADTMRSIVHEGDNLRNNAVEQIKLQFKNDQEKGLFKLNP